MAASLAAAMDSHTPKTIGENGHVEYTWSSDIKERIIQLNFQLVRCDNVRARYMLINGQQVKMVYDDPWFWLLSKSHSERPEERKKRKERPAPRLDFNTDDYVVVKANGEPPFHSPC